MIPAFRSSVDASRGHKRALIVAVLVCSASVTLVEAIGADAFKRLKGAEIKARIVGKVVTDDAHWSDRYEPDGTLSAMELGMPKPGTWKLRGDQMCVVRSVRKPAEGCFELWISRDEVEYRRDGITLTSGMLRDQ